jgi:hydroxymethylpyrimidine/phosphomethylpyrimidine kinase
MALGGYATTAITALTAQNTERVEDIHPVPPEFIQAQMLAVLNDIGADCIKTGMLHSCAVIESVAETLQAHAPSTPAVIDPVMVAQSGDRLLAEAAAERLRQLLLPRASLLTPNIPEAEALLGCSIDASVEGMTAAAKQLLELGPQAVLLKGGHAAGAEIVDVLASQSDVQLLRGERLETVTTHGTGCTLASAIATGIAQGWEMSRAVERAHAYLREALARARGLGCGCGPVEHSITVDPSAGGYTPR